MRHDLCAHLLLVLFFWALPASHAQYVELIPNPFSPFVTASAEGNQEPGLRIQLHIKDTLPAIATVRLYAGDGTPVRTLLDQVPVLPEGLALYWDGRTDEGAMVRNGRYQLLILWRSEAGGAIERSERRSVVVFK